MRCQFCGEENAEDVKTCVKCGANLAPDTPPTTASLTAWSGVGIPTGMVTTGLGFEGFRITQYLGIVRGLTVRSRGAVGNVVGQVQSFFGGNISVYVTLCEQEREEAYNLMIQHATQCGANAIIGMRYDANDVMEGITEVLAYGTAVTVAPLEAPDATPASG